MRRKIGLSTWAEGPGEGLVVGYRARMCLRICVGVCRLSDAHSAPRGRPDKSAAKGKLKPGRAAAGFVQEWALCGRA